MKVYISTNDPVVLCLYTEDEAKEWLGYDDPEDFQEIPDALVQEVIDTTATFWAAQKKLRDYQKENS
jgi:hypothetical protein